MSADFIDTNVILYLFDEVDVRKREIAERLVSEGVAARSATISHQVVQETLSALLTKRLSPDPPADARILLDRVLVPLWSGVPTPLLYARALEVQDRFGYSFYDSLILAAAIEGGCERLLSEDMQHGQRVEGVRIENPFVA